MCFFLDKKECKVIWNFNWKETRTFWEINWNHGFLEWSLIGIGYYILCYLWVTQLLYMLGIYYILQVY